MAKVEIKDSSHGGENDLESHTSICEKAAIVEPEGKLRLGLASQMADWREYVLAVMVNFVVIVSRR